ncbi:CDP-alcohol phosphatidyltransferase family protein [Thermobifida fusca]|jgi:cardiolipin synthase|uniref:CDP-diacylglycerol-phosphatidylglycerol phosphatidyltransferase n=2 Tax=Thermobifida fusca TaxID=2021 RepID=A0A9P2WQX6_THEFU|nr:MULTISPECIES: CDP-alcohol phosphatidyltransferase family protein [Thermobifida]AAZ55431.1 CDP-diacylglycerol-phosphatidylglycerol phosphatidyltransferase [Thermobifida fusca YX]EOR71464.1 CDP-diacylglycerol-phosphatidylglycerol phosphatidyltransferase [Thermobifida fusca TM51]MBO2530902.1 CDP-alcohol phosphatidyltransferase family protein [Thermobifida sp.]PPS91707.1 CDP-diacylglycerol--glycerol-3-phosphate 3-phosphatidyltransferase [Thermobifida fusca]PZN61402.1 MAG: CDP-alcohol phosphatid
MATATNQGERDDTVDRIWTIPNMISVLRLLGVPLFLWLVLGPQADLWALGVLAAAGLSDWLDGKIARAWNQTSRLGTLLDPMADRLYIFAALLGLVVRDIIPWWLMAILVLRDVLIIGALPVLRYYGYGPLPVNFAGKAATLCLLYAFPLLFLGGYSGAVGYVAQIVGWAFAIWGTALYWWAGLLYSVQGSQLIRQSRALEREEDTNPGRGQRTDRPAPQRR